MSELVLMTVIGCAEAKVAAKAKRMKSLIRMRGLYSRDLAIPGCSVAELLGLFAAVSTEQLSNPATQQPSHIQSAAMLYDPAMRVLAHQTVDALFDHVENIAGRRVVDWQSSDELRKRMRIDDRGGAEAMPLIRELMENAIQLHHPAYMGHQVCPPFPSAVIADLVISTLNQSTAVWEMSPIGTVIEQEVVRWLADRAGYPPTSLGTAVSGGSAANLTALLAARARWIDSGRSEKRPVILCSADSHYSIARAASIMGIEVVKIDTDDQHRLDLNALEVA